MGAKTQGAIVLAVAALMAGTSPGTAAERTTSPMTTAQARKVFLKSVCPLNESLMALEEAAQVPDVQWSALQPLIRQAADYQLQAAQKLAHPKRAWPANVRNYMPAVSELDFIGAGSNYSLAGVTSLAEYQALAKEFRQNASPALKKQMKDFFMARRVIHKRLDLPKGNAC